jgi:TldD protein
MLNMLKIAKERLLMPAGLSEQKLHEIFNKTLSTSIDYADMYFQSTFHESWHLEDGIVKDSHYDISQGVGVRAISGEKTGFAYSDDIELAALESAASAAKSIAKQGGERKAVILKPVDYKSLYIADNPLLSIQDAEKVALLKKVEAYARAQDPRIIQVMVGLSASYDIILIAASDGTFAADIRPLVRLNVSVIAEHNGRREQGYQGCGGRYSYEEFIHNDYALHCATGAVREALINLEAIPAPAGLMPVVLAAGWPGVLLHEAVGHGLEGDFNRKGTSAFAGRMGERVASSLCTVVDDGTLANRRGSLSIDDEGVPTQRTVLIENGILKAYMQDKHNARLMKTQSTGNGRRESYACLPLPRMTNTYMLAGSHDPEEIIRSVKKGIYAVNFGGGQVDITNGQFVFSANEAYLIENGKVTAPIKGATLIGSGPEVLTKVSMVGNDLKLDEGVGICGKEGQSVPVGVGQPTLLVDELTVGGTA